MAKETVKRLPVEEQDIRAVESWLEMMAGQGYFVCDSAGGYFDFEIRQAKKVRYRLEPVSERRGRLDSRKREDYEAMGWQYVMTHKKLYHIFMTENPDAPEIHTDSMVESITLNKIQKEMKNTLIIWGIYLLAQTVFLLILLLPKIHYPILMLAEADSRGTACLAGIFPSIFFVLRMSFLYNKIKSLRAGLEQGAVLRERWSAEQEKRDSIKYRRLSCGFLIALILVVFLGSSEGLGKKVRQSTSESRLPLTAGLERGASMENRPQAAGRQEEDGVGQAARQDGEGDAVLDTPQGGEAAERPIYHQWKPILWDYYELQDSSETWEIPSQPELEARYYEVRDFLPLEEPLYRDLSGYYLDRGLSNGTDLSADPAGLDAYRVRTDGVRQSAVARKGKKLLLLQYQGNEPLEEKAAWVEQILDEQ